MKIDFIATLRKWYDGEIDFDEKISQGKKPDSSPKKKRVSKKNIRTVPSIKRKELWLSSKIYKIFSCTQFNAIN